MSLVQPLAPAPVVSDRRVAFLVFAAVLIVYLASGPAVPDSHDTTPNAYLPVSVLTDGDLVFRPSEAPLLFVWKAAATQITVQSWEQIVPGASLTYADLARQGALQLEGPRYFLVPTLRQRAGERLFAGMYGPAAGLAALPGAVLARALGWRLERDPFAVYRVAKLTAGLLAAGSVLLVFLTALGFTSRQRALLIALAYAFGSCLWSVSSHALWQQTPEIFFLSLGVLCVARGRGAWIRGAAAGLAFSAAAACRPTAALVAFALGAYLLFLDRRIFAAYVLAAMPIGLAILAYNAYYFGSPLDFGQLAASAQIAKSNSGSPALWSTPPWVGAAGVLLSPSRGLLVFTPFFAAAFAGAVMVWREPRYSALRFLTLAVPALWLPTFVWFSWWGGWGYGYRIVVDSAPLLAMLCVPVLERIFARRALIFAFAGAIAWSVFVQILGVLAYTPGGWNGRPVNGVPQDIDLPQHNARLWSLGDSELAYLIGNFPAARAAREATVSK